MAPPAAAASLQPVDAGTLASAAFVALSVVACSRTELMMLVVVFIDIVLHGGGDGDAVTILHCRLQTLPSRHHQLARLCLGS